MKTIFVMALWAFTLTAQAKLNVVATLPDFGAIAHAVGGDKVKVTTIARGTEDAHFVNAKPSFVRLLNQADVLIEGGAELEVGWLPPLVNSARNSKILADAPGHIVLAPYVQLIEVPAGPVDRSMGDVHPLGNPHFWSDPLNGKIIAKVLAARFSQLSPQDAAFFQANCEKFIAELERKLGEWTKLMEPYRGTKAVTYHKSYDYFFQRFGLVLAGTIEPKPGVEPSPTYLSSLVTRIKTERVKLVIVEPFRPRKTPEYVARAVGAKVLLLPEKVGGNAETRDYFSLFDYDVQAIAKALAEAK